MINDCFRTLEIPCDWETFQSLPRHPAYRYEYRRGVASISPNPRFVHGLLSFAESKFTDPALRDFRSQTAASPRLASGLRRLTKDDWPQLHKLMATCFSQRAPFAHLPAAERPPAATTLLERTRNGGDGPLVLGASFVMAQPHTTQLQAALLVTLIPSDDLDQFGSSQWTSTAPRDAVQSRWGMPHITWVFVNPHLQRRGLGETLLHAAVRELDSLHYSHLASTFLLGDTPSMTWHWRMGFRLLSHPESPRRLPRNRD